MAKQNLGMVTAYAYAVVGGYEGTEAEFEALLGNIATDLEEIENLTVIATTLPAGSSATASYDHGVLTLGIPKGDKGDTGEGATVAAGTTTTGAPGTSASVVNAGTAKDAVFNFTIPRGNTGNGIESIQLTSTSGAVHTYTITFTDGNTTTFDVTDGEVTLAEISELLPTETLSGSIASFNDGQAIVPALSVIADIEPIQSGSGTPSPSNVRPISGHDDVGVSVNGVNQWDEELEQGDIATATGLPVPADYGFRTKNFIPILPNTQYYNKCPSRAEYARLWYYDADKNFISYNGGRANDLNAVITTPQNAYYMKFTLRYASYGATYNNDISINYPSTDHDYHAYNGQTYTTTLPETVYGGTLDLVSGVLTVTHVVKIFDGTENWFASSNYANRFWCEQTFVAELQASDPTSGICSHYGTFIPNATGTGSVPNDMSIGVYAGTGNFNETYVHDSRFTTANELKASYATDYANGTPVTVVYKLATPQTYQLTPQQINTLLGDNNIFADSGDVSVTYKADIQKYIDNAIATLA